MKTIILMSTGLFLATACSNNQAEPGPSTTDTVSTGQTPGLTETVFPGAEDAVPTDTLVSVHVLTTGMFHYEEFDEKLKEKTWYGIFPEDGFYLRQTSLIANRVNDPVADAETEKTGWEILQLATAVPLVLLSGPEFTEGPIPSAELPEQLFPGDSLQFELDGKSYLLFASGTGITDPSTGNQYENYSLFLSGEKDGRTITQQLVHFNYFEDAMITILFCGDMDGDRLPDLLLDNTDHYNVSNPTLYLSGNAGSDRLLKIRGWHQTVGC